jgi:membrane-bound ClpP family serine protease
LNFLQDVTVGLNKPPGFNARALAVESYITPELTNKEINMGTILIIILILLLIGGLPVFPHSRSWGYGPSGIIGVVLVVLLILLLLGKI